MRPERHKTPPSAPPAFVPILPPWPELGVSGPVAQVGGAGPTPGSRQLRDAVVRSRTPEPERPQMLPDWWHQVGGITQAVFLRGLGI